VPFTFDYRALRCFIAKHFQSQEQFAQFLGIPPAALQARLDNEVPFTQREIDITARFATNKILTAEDVTRLFFTHVVPTIGDER
jgi:hypothetical protein